jgi:uncharacterized membrane protein
VPAISFFPGGYLAFFIIFAIVGLVGYILFILAMHQLSHYYKESGIFKNIVYALIVTIIGESLFSLFSFSLYLPQ